MTSEDELGQRTQAIRAAVAGLRAEVDRLHAQLGGVPSDPAVEQPYERPEPAQASEGVDERPEPEAPPSPSQAPPEREAAGAAPPSPSQAPPEREAAGAAPPSASQAPSEREAAGETGREAPPVEGEQVVGGDAAPSEADESPQAPAAERAEEPEGEGSTAAEVAPGTEAEVVPERLAAKSDAELAKTYDLACALLEDAEGRRDQQAIAHWRSLAAAALEESVRRPDFGEAAGGSSRRLAGRRSRRLIAQLESARQLHLERTS